MVTELRELLHDSVRVPPDESLGVDDLLASARRRVRRRRAGVTAGAAALGLLVAVVPLAVTGIGGGGSTSGPAAAAPPEGRVLHLSDAVRAERGRDFEQVGAVGAGNPDGGDNGTHVDGLTPDKMVVVQVGPQVQDRWPRWALQYSDTSDLHMLPVRDDPQPPTRLLSAGRDRLVFLGEDSSARLTVWTYDRETDRWQEPVRVDGSGAGMTFESRRGASVAAGRLWFAVNDQEVATGNRDRLWSVPLTDPTDLRDEGLVGSYDVEGTSLTFMQPASPGRTPDRLHVRDLRSGDEQTYDAHTSQGCNVLGMSRDGGTITIQEYCGTADKVRDDRVVVTTTPGGTPVTLQGSDLWEESGTERFVGLMSQTAGLSGSYLYDVRAQRLLRLSDRQVAESGSMQSSGDLFTWATPAPGGGAVVGPDAGRDLLLRVARLE